MVVTYPHVGYRWLPTHNNIVHSQSGTNCTIVSSQDLVMTATASILNCMEFTKTLRDHWFSLISVTLVMTTDLDSKERPTKTIQNVKLYFKLSQTLGKCPFPGWNQLSNSLKLRPRDARHIECLEIHGILPKPLEIIGFHWFQWLWWGLAISIGRNDLPKPDRTWIFISNFLKRLAKIHFRSGTNRPLASSSPKWCPRDDRYFEYLETYRFHQNL